MLILTKVYSNAITLLLFTLFTLPLIINSTISLSFDEVYLWPKVLWNYAVILPSALLVIWQGRAVLKDRAMKPLYLLLAVWAAWLMVSSVSNGAGWPGWWGAPDRADGVLMHLLYAVVLLAGLTWARTQANVLNTFGKAALIGGALLASTNILQQLGVMGVPGEGAISGVSATLFGGTLGNRGYLGGALALLLPVAVAAVRRSSHWSWAWSAVVLISWAWAGSFTRGAWLAGGLGLVWLAVRLRRRVVVRAWLAVALGITLCLGTAELRGAGRSFSAATQDLTDSSGRGVLWHSALLGIQERPLLGWGTPALWQAMNARPERDLLIEFGTRDVTQIQRLNTQDQQAPSFFVTHNDGRREKAVLSINKVHNEYLDYALTYGIPALLLFTALMIWAVWSGRSWAPGVSAGLVAYAAYLMTWPEIIRFAPIAWFMAGLALAGNAAQRGKFQT